MSLISLPTITESQFAAYISANLAGSYTKNTPDGPISDSYTVAKGFTIDAYTLPLVVVSAGKFTELEPGTSLFEGDLIISIVTQVDDQADPVTVHDGIVGQVYSLLVDPATVQAAVNAGNFNLWSIYSTSYQQEVTEANNKRAIVSFLEYKISCQTLAV
jgi:hypothetical protein